MDTKKNLLILLPGLLFVATLGGAHPAPLGTGHYSGAGTVVTNLDGTTILDNGAVVCEDTDNDGIPDHGTGGVCIRFEDLDGDSILVTDQNVASDVLAFQVCVDVDGDGICFSPNREGAFGCKGDLILFSHTSFGGYDHNPLYVRPDLAKWLFYECGSTGFPGYIVITCAGLHAHGADSTGALDPTTSHTHQVTQGVATGVSTGGTPSGDFCGGPPTAKKAYVVH